MIGQTLLNYRILEKLGEGGQGTVYKALDTKLERPVVLKMLSPELVAKKVNLARFEREAKLASSLDHPNICTIFGLHEVSGLHFIVMQYVDGQNVRELVNGRPLELPSALSIAAQVADALSVAHARGIIHRDVKAGNVMVTDAGLVKVLDFGLAKLLENDRSSDDVHLTELGVPYGTATYAAPEQAQGGHVDHRADIFSTGVLLYEMLAGTWPFRGKNTVEVRYSVLHETPVPLAEIRPDGERLSFLQSVLDRALAKDPRARYQRMDELLADLRRGIRDDSLSGAALSEEGLHTTSGGAAIGAGPIAPIVPRHQSRRGGVAGKLRRWLRSLSGAEMEPTSVPGNAPPTALSQPQAPPRTPVQISVVDSSINLSTDRSTERPTAQSIAILPFRNLSADPQVSFYEFSLADAVITELARIASLIVRPSSMIVKYQGRAVDPVEAGREMNVTAILASSFLRVGERLRVTSQLLDVASGALLWSDRIDAAALDLIALQDTIARHIVDGLRVELTFDEEAVIARQATTNAAAYDEYLRGRDAMGRYIYHSLGHEDSQAAINHFQRAVKLDPDFALAHCALGGVYANRVIKGAGDKEDYAHATAAFDRALTLDASLIEARMHMVFIYLARGEKAQAREAVERLTRDSPNDIGVHFVKGTLHRLDGEYPQALAEFEKMLRVNPAERVVVSYNRARIFMYQRRYDDALMELEQGAAVSPDHPLIKTFQARVLYYTGETKRAAELLRDVLARQPKMDGIRPVLAMCLAAEGRTDEARRELTARAREAAEADHDIAYWMGSACAVLGEREEALRWLARAVELGNENHAWFESDPNWASLHGDPDFLALTRAKR